MQKKEVVKESQAKAEVDSWLDFHCISELQKNKNSDSIDRIVQAVRFGFVTIDDKTFSLKQKLMFPFGADDKLTELIYRPSMTVAESKGAMSAPEGEEVDDYTASVGCVTSLTGINRALIYRMNRKDFKISDAIALFLML